MMRSLKLQGRPWSFSDIPCSHAQKKGKDWMERCTTETCFLTIYRPNWGDFCIQAQIARWIQSTHRSGL